MDSRTDELRAAASRLRGLTVTEGHMTLWPRHLGILAELLDDLARDLSYAPDMPPFAASSGWKLAKAINGDGTMEPQSCAVQGCPEPVVADQAVEMSIATSPYKELRQACQPHLDSLRAIGFPVRPHPGNGEAS